MCNTSRSMYLTWERSQTDENIPFLYSYYEYNHSLNWVSLCLHQEPQGGWVLSVDESSKIISDRFFDTIYAAMQYADEMLAFTRAQEGLPV